MTFPDAMVRFGDAIAGDYAKSWKIGAWFVVPFATVGYVAQEWGHLPIEPSLLIAMLVALPVVGARAFLEIKVASSTANNGREVDHSAGGALFPWSEHLFLSAGHAPPELTDPFVERLLIAGDFRIAIRNVGDVAVLQLAGRVTPGTGAEVFRDAIQIVSARGRSKILLNLAEVSNIDSSGIGEIVSSFTEVTNRGGQVKIVNLTKRVQDLLQIARLYEVYDDEIRAIRSFAEYRG